MSEHQKDKADAGDKSVKEQGPADEISSADLDKVSGGAHATNINPQPLPPGRAMMM